MENDTVECSTSGHIKQVISQAVTEESQVEAFHCSHCVLIFESKVYLFEHLYKVHGLNTEISLREAGLSPGTDKANTESSSSGDNFKCQRCDFKACSWDGLSEHEELCHKTSENPNVSGGVIISENLDSTLSVISANQNNEAAGTSEDPSVLSDISTSEANCTLKDLKILQESPSSSCPNSSGVFKVTAKSVIDITGSKSYPFLHTDLTTDLTKTPEQFRKETVPDSAVKRSSGKSLKGHPVKKAKLDNEEMLTENENRQQSSSSEVSEDEDEADAAKVYSCKHCDYSDVGIRRISAHYQSDHPYIRYNSVYIQDASDHSATFRCLECPVEFLSTADLKRHYLENHPDAPDVFAMKSCGLSLVFKCFLCKFTINLLKSLKEHYKAKHATYEVENSLLFCRYSMSECQEESSQLSLDVHYQKSHPDEVITLDKIKQSVCPTSHAASEMTSEKCSDSVIVVDHSETTPEACKNRSESSQTTKGESSKFPTKSSNEITTGLDISSSSLPNETFYCQFCSYTSTKVKSILGHHYAKHSMDAPIGTDDVLGYSAEMQKRQSESKMSKSPSSSQFNTSKQVKMCREKEDLYKEDYTADASETGERQNKSYACPENLFYCHKCNFGNPSVKGVINHQAKVHRKCNSSTKCVLEYTALIHDEIRKANAKDSSSSRLPPPIINEGEEKAFFCHFCNYRHSTLDHVMHHYSRIHHGFKAKTSEVLLHTSKIHNQAQKSLLTSTQNEEAAQEILKLKMKKKKTRKHSKSLVISATPSVTTPHRKRSLNCYACAYKTDVIYALKTHLRKIHKVKRTVTDILRYYFRQGLLEPGYYCEFCVFRHEKAAAVYEHYEERHLGRVPCVEYVSFQLYVGPGMVHCKKKKPDLEQSGGNGTENRLLSQRYGQNRAGLSCKRCSFKSKSLSDLAHHYRMVHPLSAKLSKKTSASWRVEDQSDRPGSLSSKVFKCLYCSANFNSKKGLHTHCGLKHPEAVIERYEQEQKPEQQLQKCLHKTLKSSITAEKSSNKQLYKCQMCTYKGRYQYLQRHYKNTHKLDAVSIYKLLEKYNKRKWNSPSNVLKSGNSTKVKCLKCPELTFKSSQLLIDHYSTFHRSEWKLDFTVLSLGSKTMKTTGVYKCDHCNTQLNGIRKLCYHMDRHRARMLKKAKAAQRKESLISTTLEQESSEPCRQDEMTTLETVNEVNRWNGTRVQSAATSELSDVQQPELESNGDKHTCKQCGRMFMSLKGLHSHEHSHAAIKKLDNSSTSGLKHKKTLEMHMETGHSTCQSKPTHQKDLCCPFCLYQTKNKNNMIDHIVLHRGERVVPIEVRRPKLSRCHQGIIFGSKKVMKNHELVGQGSLDQLEASVDNVPVTEEEEEHLSNMDQLDKDRGEVEMEDLFADCDEVPQAENLEENYTTEKSALQIRECQETNGESPGETSESDIQHENAKPNSTVQQELQKQAELVLLETAREQETGKVEQSVTEVKITDTPCEDYGDSEEDRQTNENQAQPEFTESGDKQQMETGNVEQSVTEVKITDTPCEDYGDPEEERQTNEDQAQPEFTESGDKQQMETGNVEQSVTEVKITDTPCEDYGNPEEERQTYENQAQPEFTESGDKQQMETGNVEQSVTEVKITDIPCEDYGNPEEERQTYENQAQPEFTESGDKQQMETGNVEQSVTEVKITDTPCEDYGDPEEERQTNENQAQPEFTESGDKQQMETGNVEQSVTEVKITDTPCEDYGDPEEERQTNENQAQPEFTESGDKQQMETGNVEQSVTEVKSTDTPCEDYGNPEEERQTYENQAQPEFTESGDKQQMETGNVEQSVTEVKITDTPCEDYGDPEEERQTYENQAQPEFTESGDKQQMETGNVEQSVTEVKITDTPCEDYGDPEEERQTYENQAQPEFTESGDEQQMETGNVEQSVTEVKITDTPCEDYGDPEEERQTNENQAQPEFTESGDKQQMETGNVEQSVTEVKITDTPCEDYGDPEEERQTNENQAQPEFTESGDKQQMETGNVEQSVTEVKITDTPCEDYGNPEEERQTNENQAQPEFTESGDKQQMETGNVEQSVTEVKITDTPCEDYGDPEEERQTNENQAQPEFTESGDKQQMETENDFKVDEETPAEKQDVKALEHKTLNIEAKVEDDILRHILQLANDDSKMHNKADEGKTVKMEKGTEASDIPLAEESNFPLFQNPKNQVGIEANSALTKLNIAHVNNTRTEESLKIERHMLTLPPTCAQLKMITGDILGVSFTKLKQEEVHTQQSSEQEPKPCTEIPVLEKECLKKEVHSPECFKEEEEKGPFEQKQNQESEMLTEDEERHQDQAPGDHDGMKDDDCLQEPEDCSWQCPL
ncbi:uncharacterized protein LOC112435653 isoform X1 [Maylandia zebra]|uniref:uncharacterized protein LOC112435653 isoform X1 n=3 Tax=Maylandia zebra TaxID=106582 RepID=UPI00403D1677